MRRVIISTAAAVLMVGGCGAGQEPDGPPPFLTAQQAPAAPVPQATLRRCVDMFVPGGWVPAPAGTELGCLDPDGQAQIIPLIRCADGSHLGSVPAAAGPPAGWFQAPGRYRAAEDVSTDPGYKRAYIACSR